MAFNSYSSGSEVVTPFRRGEEVRVRARYGPSDIATLLWRERGLMIVVFLVILVLGVAAALRIHTLYSAQSSVLVRLGQEYVYQPLAGDAARGAIPESDAEVQSEVEILSSAQLKQQVIEKIGLSRLYPKIGAGYDSADPETRRLMMGRAIGAMDKGLKIASTPGAPVVRISFQHPDPQMAALALNTLLDQYLVYRRSVLLDQTAPIVDQRKAFEARLAQADEAYENFLGSNNIGDFETEKASLAQLQSSLQQQKFTADDQLKEKQGELDGLSQQAGQLAPEIGLYHDVDHAAQDKLTDLKVQRENLLGRYRPDSSPVRDMDAQIATLEHAIAAGAVQGEGAKRVGVNPVYQTVQSDKIQASAQISALQQSSEALGAQIDQVTERQLRLAQLEPQYQGLTRDRDVLQNNVRDFTVKEQQTEAADAIAKQGDDNISIVERAVVPTQGKSMKMPVLMLSALLAGFTALCVGLLRVFLRPGIPTSASAARTLDLPVLATARMKSSAGGRG